MNAMWTVEELAYFAAIIDGEGCISLCGDSKSQKTNRYSAQLFIGNTDERLIRWIHERFGGTVGFRARRNLKHKPLWFTYFSGAMVEAVLSAVVPYLVMKKEQAELMLAFRKTLESSGRSGVTPLAVVEHRAEIKARMAVLNKRGTVG